MGMIAEPDRRHRQELPDKIGGDPASKAADLRHHPQRRSAGARVPGLGRHRRRPRRARRRVHGRRRRPRRQLQRHHRGHRQRLRRRGGKAFDPLWKKHIGFLVDYTTAWPAKDQAKADKAMSDLLQYAEDFGAFINTASPKLAKDAVAELVKTHVLTLKDVIDAQAAKELGQGLHQSCGPPPTTWP